MLDNNYEISLPEYYTSDNKGLSTFGITAEGFLKVVNTGGSSAGDGGMGSGNRDDKEKGELTNPGGGKGSDDTDEDFTFDPIKKNVRENEKDSKKDQ